MSAPFVIDRGVRSIDYRIVVTEPAQLQRLPRSPLRHRRPRGGAPHGSTLDRSAGAEDAEGRQHREQMPSFRHLGTVARTDQDGTGERSTSSCASTARWTLPCTWSPP